MLYGIEPYKHFGRCLFVSNGVVEFTAALEFGIRILRFSLCGEGNLFYEQDADADYLCTPGGWRVYGGHRLAFAPESDKTYWPDTEGVHHEILPNGIRLDQREDRYLHIEKSIIIQFTENPHELSITHKVRNTGSDAIAGAPWAITAVAPPGTLSVPFPPPPGNGLCAAPNRFISLWNNTSLADKRLSFMDDSIEIRHLPVDDYFKIGLRSAGGSVKYQSGERQIFTKTVDTNSVVIYPDNNINVEVFACKYMMEIETLGPLGTIQPGEERVHRETWGIIPCP
jgi:hypothetical protein